MGVFLYLTENVEIYFTCVTTVDAMKKWKEIKLLRK